MTEKETSQLLAVILEVYPAFGKGRDPKFTTQIWHALFQNIPFEQAKQALMIFIATDTKGFAPAPGMIREIILDAGKQEEAAAGDSGGNTQPGKAASMGLNGRMDDTAFGGSVVSAGLRRSDGERTPNQAASRESENRSRSWLNRAQIFSGYAALSHRTGFHPAVGFFMRPEEVPRLELE